MDLTYIKKKNTMDLKVPWVPLKYKHGVPWKLINFNLCHVSPLLFFYSPFLLQGLEYSFKEKDDLSIYPEQIIGHTHPLW